jgi:hypothetical protein
LYVEANPRLSTSISATCKLRPALFSIFPFLVCYNFSRTTAFNVFRILIRIRPFVKSICTWTTHTFFQRVGWISHIWWDFVMDKSGAGGRFSLRELRFPLSIYIPSASPQSSSLSPEVGTIGQEWPQCQ